MDYMYSLISPKLVVVPTKIIVPDKLRIYEQGSVDTNLKYICFNFDGKLCFITQKY